MSLIALGGNGGATGSGGGGGGSPTGAAGGDLGGSYPNPTVTSGAHLGSKSVPIAALANDGTVDGKYLKSSGGIWVPTAVAYSDLTGVPASFTPSAHQSTHLPGGSDPIDWSGKVHMSGLDANKPAAAASNAGLLYFSTDVNGGTWYRSTGASWVQVTKGLTAAPTAHASTHLGGSDDLTSIMQLNPYSPSRSGYAYETPIQLAQVADTVGPAAGVIYLSKLMTPYGFTISNIDVWVNQAGSGATALANCYVGVFDSSGTRQFASADQSTAWGTTGVKRVTIGGGYTVSGSYIYLALLVGTQSTTNVKFGCFTPFSASLMAFNLTNATLIAGTNSSGLSALPASITLANNATTARNPWFGVS